MTRVFAGLGANIGNRRENLRAAMRAIGERATISAVSSLYRSPAMVPEGAAPGPDFLNAVCEFESEATPKTLLAFFKEIEQALGRRPAERWAARPIDIDLLLYGDAILETPALVVPHPGIASRNFVLVPLAELASDVVHPLLGRTIGELAEDVDYDDLEHLEGPDWNDGGQRHGV